MRRSPLALVLLLTALVGCAAPSPSPSAASAQPVASRSPLFTLSPTPNVTPAPAETSLPSISPPAPSAPGVPLTLVQLLEMLPVAPEDRSGYDRALFRHWIDADGDGCNTRREVLVDEAVVPPTVGGGCSLFGGQWLSAYDGLVLTDAGALDIDHVVALAEAWDSGASAWSQERRMQFANDVDVSWALIAVSAASNRSKGDKDPADWLPPDAGDLCPFVSAWIAVKARWGLTADQRELDALTGLVAECPGARMSLAPADQ